MIRRHALSLPMPGGAQLFQRMFTRLGLHGRLPLFDVRFHPYANLTVTIRMRQETAYVRFSDVMSGAPLAVLEAAAAIVLARMYRRKARRQWLEVFRDYSYHEDTRRQLETVRRLRARQVRGDGAGQHHDLESLFEQLNEKYFEGALQMPRIGWSGRTWRAQLGCFDPALHQIAINRRLDRAGRAGIRGGLRDVSRDAAPEASAKNGALPAAVAFGGISERGEEIPGLRGGAEISVAATVAPLTPALIPVATSGRTGAWRFSFAPFWRPPRRAES